MEREMSSLRLNDLVACLFLLSLAACGDSDSGTTLPTGPGSGHGDVAVHRDGHHPRRHDRGAVHQGGCDDKTRARMTPATPTSAVYTNNDFCDDGDACRPDTCSEGVLQGRRLRIVVDLNM